MNNIIFIIFIFFISNVTIFSQTTIKGFVSDENNNPLEYVSVLIKSDTSKTISNYTRTNKDGFYNLKINKNGNFLLIFSDFYHENDTIELRIENNRDTILNRVNLFPKTKVINQVFIKVDNQIRVKGDTISYDAKYFTFGGEKVVEDLLKNLPGVNVSEDGVVRFGNKEVEKIMVEGDDFFEKGYRLLTKSMPSTSIDKIEVIKNVSLNKHLKGIENSDKVVLNLKIDETVKRKWFGNITLLKDVILKKNYQTTSTIMNFGKKSKYYFLSNLNNIGEDATNDIKYLIQPSTNSDMNELGDGVLINPILDLQNSPLNLKEKRYLFNNTKLASLNSIFTLSEKTKIKILGLLNTEKNNYLSSNNYSFSMGEIKFSNIENIDINKKKQTELFKLDLIHDFNKNNTLEFFSTLNLSKSNYTNQLTFNTVPTLEKVNSNFVLSDNKVRFTSKITDKTVLIFTSRFIKNNLPQNYSIDKYFYSDILYNDSNLNNVYQSVNNNLTYFGFEAYFISKFDGGHIFEIRLGDQYRKSNLFSDFSLNSNTQLLYQPIDFKNDLTYTNNEFFLRPKFKYKLSKCYLSFELDLIQFHNKINYLATEVSKNPFFINPKFSLSWEINPKNKLIFSSAYNKSNTLINDIFNSNINTGLRYFNRGTGQLNQLSGLQSILNYSYGKYGQKFFINSLILFTKEFDFISSNSLINKNYTLVNSVLLKNRESILISGNLNRYLKFISSNLKINLSLNYSTFKNIVNINYINNVDTKTISTGLELRSGFHKFFNYHFGSNFYFNQIYRNVKNSYNSNLSFLDLNFKVNKKIMFTLQSEYYYFQKINIEKNQYLFLDCDIEYTIKPNKFIISLINRNILNNTNYNSFSLSDVSIISHQSRLLPRYSLVKLEYKF